MDLRQMQYVVALADERQFTRAAALSGVSQSGLSAAIRTLEDELGTALFARSPRVVQPTDAGLALLPFARTMLAQATAARDAETPEWIVSVVTSPGSSPAPQLLELLEVDQAGTVETANVRRNGNGVP
jgi:DNA-binding transcriptional LysR family regulator